MARAGKVLILDVGLFCSRKSGDRPPALLFGVYGYSEEGDSKRENSSRRLGSNHSGKVPPNIKIRDDPPAFPRQHHLPFRLLEPQERKSRQAQRKPQTQTNKFTRMANRFLEKVQGHIIFSVKKAFPSRFLFHFSGIECGK
jgi:hypothetical protein